ncbi:MAG: tetratricopeptide repeat protein [Opitutaceae bacterium]
MLPFLIRRLVPALLIAALLSCLPGRLAADLVWNPNTGWSVEGGALSGVVGSERTKAVELMNKARRAEDRQSYGSAISSYGKVQKKYPNSIYAPEALYRMGKLRLLRKQYYGAFDAFQQIIGRYPNTKRFNEIIGLQYRIASDLLDGKRSYIWGLFPGPTGRSNAIAYFEVIVADAPYSDYAPLCLMNVARGHQLRSETDEAIDALDRLINSYPQSLLSADAYFKLAQAHGSLVEGPYYDQASTKEAITYYEDFMILFPSDINLAKAAKGLEGMKTMLAESKIKMADFYFYKRDNYVAAKVFYNEAITAYPDSEPAQRAKLMLAKVEAKVSGKPVVLPTDVPAPKRKKFLGIF